MSKKDPLKNKRFVVFSSLMGVISDQGGKALTAQETRDLCIQMTEVEEENLFSWMKISSRGDYFKREHMVIVRCKTPKEELKKPKKSKKEKVTTSDS